MTKEGAARQVRGARFRQSECRSVFREEEGAAGATARAGSPVSTPVCWAGHRHALRKVTEKMSNACQGPERVPLFPLGPGHRPQGCSATEPRAQPPF